MGVICQLQKTNYGCTELFELGKYWLGVFPDNDFRMLDAFPDPGSFLAEILPLGHKSIMAITLYYRLLWWAKVVPIRFVTDSSDDHLSPNDEAEVYLIGDYHQLIQDVAAAVSAKNYLTT